MTTYKRDTGKAKLPGLPPVNAQDPALRNWISAVAERLEVREGSRGNPYERAVTLRELEAATAGLVQITDGAPDPAATNTVQLGNGLSASINIDRFIDSIRSTRLYRDLLRRLDDPTRFDHLAEEIRNVLLRNIADEAAARGADIRRTETLIQDVNRSLAMAVTEITAALQNNAAGIREVQAAYVNENEATATQITQLQASLGDYYLDGSPGRVSLEEELTVQASFVNGLRGQYTLKIQAGGALAGFGIAAEEVNGVPSSAFIINADKFAIVSPDYSGGLTTSPDVSIVPFGVDANGIYLNDNVYVRGQLRVDTGGRTLADGLRGSLDLAATGTAWSDTLAHNTVWTALGQPGTSLDSNHLVIGDAVTISGTNFIETRYWTGSAWAVPGAIINGNLLVNGSVSASKINTNGLEIKDDAGHVIFSSGTPLDYDTYVAGGPPTDATRGAAFNYARVLSVAYSNQFTSNSTWTNIFGLGSLSNVVWDADTDNRCLQIGSGAANDQAWMVTSATPITYSAGKLYRMRLRVRRRTEGTGLFYAGFEAMNSSGTVIDRFGTAARVASMHWFVADELALPVSEEWTECVGYVSGLGNTNAGQYAPDPFAPATMRTETVRVRPVFVANWEGQPGVIQVDYLTVEEVIAVPATVEGQITPTNISTWISSAAIGEAYIASAAITSAKIAAASITDAHISDLSVDELKIKDGSVTYLDSISTAPTAVTAFGAAFNVALSGDIYEPPLSVREIARFDMAAVASRSVLTEIGLVDRRLDTMAGYTIRHYASNVPGYVLIQTSNDASTWTTQSATPLLQILNDTGESTYVAGYMLPAVSYAAVTAEAGSLYTPTNALSFYWRSIAGTDYKFMRKLLDLYGVWPGYGTTTFTASWTLLVPATGEYTLYYCTDDIMESATLNSSAIPLLNYDNDPAMLAQSVTTTFGEGVHTVSIQGRNTGGIAGIAACLVDSDGVIVWHSRMAQYSTSAPRFARILLSRGGSDTGCSVSFTAFVKATRK